MMLDYSILIAVGAGLVGGAIYIVKESKLWSNKLECRRYLFFAALAGALTWLILPTPIEKLEVLGCISAGYNADSAILAILNRKNST